MNGVAPDLIVHFGDLALALGRHHRRRRGRSTPSRTTPARTTRTTPRTGSSIIAGPGSSPGRRDGMHLLDIAPTVLELLGIDGAGGDARAVPAQQFGLGRFFPPGGAPVAVTAIVGLCAVRNPAPSRRSTSARSSVRRSRPSS